MVGALFAIQLPFVSVSLNCSYLYFLKQSSSSLNLSAVCGLSLTSHFIGSLLLCLVWPLHASWFV